MDKRQGRQKKVSKKYTNQKERHGWEGRKTQGKKEQRKKGRRKEGHEEGRKAVPKERMKDTGGRKRITLRQEGK